MEGYVRCVRWVRDYKAGVFRGGAFQGVDGIVLDITDRKEASRKLEESEQAYRAIAEDMPVLICCFRPDFKITYVNKAYCTYFRKTVEQ